MKHSILTAILSLFCLLGFAQLSQPLKGDLVVHDPVMIKAYGKYYIFHTGHGVSIKSSEDGINWKNAGRVFAKDKLPAWHKQDIPEQDGHLWAPDIHYRDGKYHLYYSVSAWMNFNSSIGYATNTTLDPNNPNYKWVDHGQVISYKNGGEGVNVIDPNVFVERDGSVWLFYGSYKAGLRLTQLDPKTGMLLSEQPELTTITPGLGEGVYVQKSGDYYYIFASRGKCCAGIESTYNVVMGRAKNILGPYLDKKGLSWTDNKSSRFMIGDHEHPGVGHNGFYTENDTTYIVYHAYTRSKDGAPILTIKPVYMDENKWPTLDKTDVVFRAE